MKVKIKRLHPMATIPSYAKTGDAGLDLTVTEVESLGYPEYRFKFGVSVEIPAGYVGLLFPRSSIYKTGMSFTNAVGVIDSGYRGEIMAIMRDQGDYRTIGYHVGQKAAQLIIIPYPQIEFEEVDRLSESERGAGGYGSSGE